jgi:hypothetical protein
MSTGHGAGRALVTRMRAALDARSWTPVLVWVLARNRAARAFYEHLGALPVRRAREDVGGRVVVKIAYAWLDA